MTINKKLEAAKLELLLEGRLDTTTSAYAGGRTEAVHRGRYRAGIRF